MSIRFNSTRRRNGIVSLAVAAGLLGWSAAGNEAIAAFPERPIRLLVGFAPGGGNDILARYVAQRLQESLKQTVIVENRPGASGLLAVEGQLRHHRLCSGPAPPPPQLVLTELVPTRLWEKP